MPNHSDTPAEIRSDWSEIVNAAFMGPGNMWDKTYDTNIKLELMDLDEFLTENNLSLPADNPGTSQPLPYNPATYHPTEQLENQVVPLAPLSPVDSLTPSLDSKGPSSIDSLGSDQLNSHEEPSPGPYQDAPRFILEDLKTHPPTRKSRKQFVPDNLKDDRYWTRRYKNNMAAKRSRDARRIKENQVAVRAAFLERENNSLRQQISRLQKESAALRDRLSKHEKV